MTVRTRWRAKLRIRETLLHRAIKKGNHNLIAKRRGQVAYAERVLKRHSKAPMRVTAWHVMDHLINEKVTERGGNNRGAAVEKIIRGAGGVPGEAWCGDTVAYCYLMAGSKSVVRAWAAVSQLERLLTRVRLTRNVRRGHVVTYLFDHTGLFDRWAPEHGRGYFYAGEGNTGNSGAVSDSLTGGDGVKLKLRHVSQVQGFYRVRR